MANTSTSWVRGTCIGRGAYGTVNIAVNISTAAVFAVKSVDLQTSLPSQVQALENEIAILKTLSSNYIVKYLGNDTTTSSEGGHLIRNLHMEYLPGGTAADLAPQSMDEPSVRSYTWCLVSALSYLHARGIIHCDVKGRNVLLGPTPGSAKLADFGSASNQAASIAPRGSPLWMAPEVMRGEYQGPESDVWSLGCTVIEMLTGKPVFEAISVTGGCCSDELLRRRIPTGLSTAARDFLDKCFRKDYRERWSSDQLMQHPFISMCSHSKTLYDYSSPRCVLEFNYCSDDDDEILNLGARGRIRGLVSEAGANWELDYYDWINVRGDSNFSVEQNGVVFVNHCSSSIRIIVPSCSQVNIVGSKYIYFLFLRFCLTFFHQFKSLVVNLMLLTQTSYGI